ncbi:MAG TPA: ATP-binding protein [bacterium]|nr:ATP-binding protein [bacterium]HOL47031.1 ATP-binding protein [bacterium]HPQ18467.1 ATP-binding protein [bacterium]
MNISNYYKNATKEEIINELIKVKVELQNLRKNYIALKNEKEKIEEEIKINNELLAIQKTKKSYKKLINEKIKAYENLLSALPVIVYKIDENGFFTYVNDEIKSLGYKKEELIGKHFSVIVHPDDLEKISRKYVLPKYKGKITGSKYSPKLFDERRTGSRKTSNLLIRLIPKESKEDETYGILTSYGEVVAAGSYLKNENNSQKKVGTVGIIVNVTEKIRLQNQLLQTEKLTAVGQLAAGISHEFNNILGIILGNTQLLSLYHQKRIKNLHSKAIKLLQTIERQTKIGSDIVSRLLQFASPKEPQKNYCKIEDVINEVINMQKKQLQLENIEIICNYYTHSLVNIDKIQMQQVILNLILNARDAIKPKGSGKIIIETKQIEDKIVIIFQDTGIGMADDIKKKIFEPFFTTKGAHSQDSYGLKGTGLGLSIIYMIIQNHNGIIDVESEVNKGTTFTITLPVADFINNKKSDDKKNLIKLSKKCKKLKVLIVDDEIEFTELFKNVLLQYGIKNVITSNVSKEALSLIFTNDFDVIFLDLLLPEMSGEVLFKKIKEIKNYIPVIFISGKLNLDIEKYLLDGIFAFLQKPFTNEDLIEILNKVAEYRKN